MIRKGDRVKLVRKVGSNTEDWNNDWTDEMDDFVGKTFIVAALDGNQVRFEGSYFWFPLVAIVKVQTVDFLED